MSPDTASDRHQQHLSYNDDDSFEGVDDDDFHVLGTATAMYPFDGELLRMYWYMYMYVFIITCHKCCIHVRVVCKL